MSIPLFSPTVERMEDMVIYWLANSGRSLARSPEPKCLATCQVSVIERLPLKEPLRVSAVGGFAAHKLRDAPVVRAGIVANGERRRDQADESGGSPLCRRGESLDVANDRVGDHEERLAA